MPKLSCTDCGCVLADDPGACPSCGSHRRTATATGGGRARAKAGGEVRVDLLFPSGASNSKRRRWGSHVSNEVRRSDGALVSKEQWFDKDADRYVERVILRTTGEVLRDVDEKLSDHRGHGSDGHD